MATFNNSLIPNYSAAAKTKASNGFNTMMGNDQTEDELGFGNQEIDSYVNLLMNDPQAQENYKSQWQSGGTTTDTGFNNPSGSTVPVNPIEHQGKLVYPWESQYQNLALGGFGGDAWSNVQGFDPVGQINDPVGQTAVPSIQEGPAQATQNVIPLADPNQALPTAQTAVPSIQEGERANVQKDIPVAAPASVPTIGEGPAQTTQKAIPLADPNQALPAGQADPLATEDINQSYMDEIRKVLAGEQGFAGTETAVSSQREALAAFAKDMQAKAGAGVAKSGGLGQGTAGGAAQGVAQNVMQELAGQERDIATARAGDFKEALSLGREAFESDRAFEEAQKQFGESLGLQKEQFGLEKQKFGSQENQLVRENFESDRAFQEAVREFDANVALQRDQLVRSNFESDRAFEEATRTFNESLDVQKQQLLAQNTEADLKALEAMAGDNPALLSKVIDVRMDKQGIEFTAEEEAELLDFYEKKAIRQEALDAAELAVLEALPETVKKQIESINESTEVEKITERVESDPTKLQPGDWAKLGPEEKAAMYESENFIKEAPFTSPSMGQLEGGNLSANADMYAKNPWLKDSAGKMVEIGGTMYKISDPPVSRIDNNAGIFQDTQYKQVVWAINVETGKKENIYETDFYD